MNIVRLTSDFPSKRSAKLAESPAAPLGPNVYALSVEQRRIGHEISVICKGNGATEEIDGISILRVKGSFNQQAFLKLISQKRNHSVDVVHMHATAGFISATFSKSISIAPLVAHVHGTTIGSSFLNASPHDRLKVALALARENVAWKGANRVIAVSRSTARELSEYYGIPEERIDVVYNGVDEELFRAIPERESKRKEFGWEDKKVVLFVGRIAPLKGLNDLVQAAKLLSSKRSNVLIAIAGDVARFQRQSTSGYFQKLRDLVHSEGLTQNVIFLGGVPNSKLPELYSAADVFVLPSHSEGTPKVVLEAMSCEKPCVVTLAGGMPELITENEGRLVPVRSPSSLAQALGDLLDDEDQLRRMGLSARKTILQRFTWKRAAEQVNKVYSKL